MRASLKINVFIGFLLILLMTRVSADLPASIQVDVTMENSQLSHKQDIIVKTTFVNPTQSDISLLKWQLPTTGILHEDLFIIKNSRQEKIKYRGKIYKRLEPQVSDFLVLKAGEKITIKTNLSLSYELTQSGFYTINYKQKNTTSSPFHFTLIDDRTQQKTLSGVQQIAVNSCNSNQKNKLEKVLLEASKITKVTSALLNTIKEGQRSNADRYWQWFGDYDTDRYETVASYFKTFQDALDNKEITFSCDCNDSAIAYVFPDVAYEIHLCSSFWDLALNGTDSQAGTIIHELSHFKVTSHTDDHVYGKLGAKQLAYKTPDIAINNADNYEYFAENANPYLSMYSQEVADKYEPDNKKLAAKLIFPATPQVHTIQTDADEDWSKFELFFPSYVNLFVNGPENGDTEIYLFDNNGKKLASNDDRDSTNNQSYSEISKDSLPAGTYYVKVNGYKKNTTVQEYQLTLTTVQSEGPKKNQDSNKSAAGSLNLSLLILLLMIGFLQKSKKKKLHNRDALKLH